MPGRRLSALGLSLALLVANGQDHQGINVGHPKVYDNRTLNVMLDELNAQLAQMRVMDQAKLAAAIGAVQGMETRESSKGTTVGFVNPFKNPDGTEKVPNQGAIPWNMDLDKFSPLGPSSQSYGMASQDLLGDQVSLQYQIFNLRMILDRSLTDRLIEGSPKLSAVLGIPVSLDPPRQAIDSAAIVEVRLRRRDGTPFTKDKQVSLVALMPQEKTYNSVALSRKSNAFGASAVAKVVQVGFSSIQRGQTYFMYRDNDTIAFEDRRKDELVFGWQFRPVLGRRSVAPGIRQMFAVVALPSPDNPESQPQELQMTVTTRWVKYQRSTLTTHPTSLWFERFGEWIGKPVPPPADPKVNREFPIEIPTTDQYQRDLEPVIEDVTWVWVGKKELLVSVEGKNFFSDTKVLIGGKTYDASNGLKIKSEKELDLLLDGSLLSEGVVQGRYGASAPLRPKTTRIDSGKLEIESAEWRTIDGHATVDIILAKEGPLETADLPRFFSADKRARTERSDGLLEPQITVNGTLLPGPFEFYNLADRKRVLLRVLVPSELVKKSDRFLSVRYPFRGDRWQASISIEDPNKYFTVTRWRAADESKPATPLQTPAQKSSTPATPPAQKKNPAVSAAPPVAEKASPAKPLAVFLVQDKFKSMTESTKLSVFLTSGRELPLKQSNCPPETESSFCRLDKTIAIVRAAEDEIGEQLILRNLDLNMVYVVDVPEKKKKEATDKPAADKPEAKSAKEVSQYDSVWLATDFSAAKRLEADGQEIRSRVNKGKVEALLTRAITHKPGEVDLFVEGAVEGDEKPSTKVIRIRIVCRECEAKTTEAKKDASKTEAPKQ